MTPNPGPGVDAGGQPVIDPTQNVRELVLAAIQRQDDLREAEQRHIHEILALRATHVKDLREAESARIDAIRRVDVEAVQRAAEVQAHQATALAAQVAAAAEATRTQIAAIVAQFTASLATAVNPIQKDIQDLRRAQYEAQGQKTQVVETRAGGQQVGLWVGLVFGLLSLIISAIVVIVLLSSSPTA